MYLLKAAKFTVLNLYFVLQCWKTFIENQEHAVSFKIFFLIGNPGKISEGKKPFEGEIYSVIS